MTDDQNENAAGGDIPAALTKDEQNEDLENIAANDPKVKAAALAAIPELSADQHAGLRYLIAAGHNLNFDPPFKNAKDARIAAAVGMLDAGLPPDVVLDVLLDDRLALSRTSKKGDAKRQMLAGEVQIALSKRRGAEVEAAKKLSDGAEDPNEVLAELNSEHFVAQESGQWRVYNEVRDDVFDRIALTRSLPSEFTLAYGNRFVEVSNDDGKPAVKKLGTWWLDHPRRRQYKRIAFLPGRECDSDSGTYNLWRGFAVEPKPGDWSLLKEHVLRIVCCGDQGHYDYLLKWMANTVQNPDSQGWSAVVMKGHEGVGKGMLAQSFGSLFGQHFVHISQARHLVGNFNLHMRDCLVLFADEAFWSGDKQGESVMKALVTESMLPIEGKGRDLVMGRNRLHIFIATNNEWAIPAGPTARRYFVLRVSDEKRGAQHKQYFDAIVQQMADGGRAAMLAELLSIDLKGFDVRKVPMTAELLDQKIRSYSPEEAWWLDRLMAGSQLRRDDCWQPEVPVDQLHDDYVAAVGKAGTARKSTATKLGMFLRTVLPAEWPGDSFPTLDVPDPHAHPNEPSRTIKRQVRCYTMPDLAECREHFDRRAGGQSHGWPDRESNL